MTFSPSFISNIFCLVTCPQTWWTSWSCQDYFELFYYQLSTWYLLSLGAVCLRRWQWGCFLKRKGQPRPFRQLSIKIRGEIAGHLNRRKFLVEVIGKNLMEIVYCLCIIQWWHWIWSGFLHVFFFQINHYTLNRKQIPGESQWLNQFVTY